MSFDLHGQRRALAAIYGPPADGIPPVVRSLGFRSARIASTFAGGGTLELELTEPSAMNARVLVYTLNSTQIDERTISVLYLNNRSHCLELFSLPDLGTL